jgi:tetratricopeptide (TPR) repeat protein
MIRSCIVTSLAVVVCWSTTGRSDDKPRLSPAEIAERLAPLAGADQALTEQEKALLADAADGKFSRVTLAEAALLASGVRDDAKRAKYLVRIDELEKQARIAVAKGEAFEKGEGLLKWLHAGPAKKYEQNQDHLPDLLDDGKFNCVSVTTCYAILGRRLGLDVRGLLIQVHIWGIQYHGDKFKEVETTNARGYDPKRKRNSRPREVGEFGIVAAVYRNQASRLDKQERHAEALRAAAFAGALDPNGASNLGDLERVFHNWHVLNTKKDRYDEALAVLKLGLEMAPGNRKLVGDRRNTYALWAQACRKRDEWAKAVELLTKAAKDHPDDRELPLDAAKEYVYWARHLEKQGDSTKAAEVLENGADSFPKSTVIRSERERLRKKNVK